MDHLRVNTGPGAGSARGCGNKREFYLRKQAEETGDAKAAGQALQPRGLSPRAGLTDR